MIIRTEELIKKLKAVVYFNHMAYKNEAFLFVTLYKEEEPEGYVIIDPVSEGEYLQLIAAIQSNQQ